MLLDYSLYLDLAQCLIYSRYLFCLSQKLYLNYSPFQPYFHVTESQTFKNERKLGEYLFLSHILSLLIPANAWTYLHCFHQIFIQLLPLWHEWNLVSGWSSDSLGINNNNGSNMVAVFVDYLLVATCYMLAFYILSNCHNCPMIQRWKKRTISSKEFKCHMV